MVGIIISFILATIFSTLMVLGIDHMQKNHPDYKGKDLFGEENDDDWDSTLMDGLEDE